MENLELAKKLLIDEDLSLVLVKEGQVIYKSKARGIRPIYDLYLNYKDQAKGGALADKVIGRAAAIFAKDLQIKSLYAGLISQAAIEVLTGIGVFYQKTVPRILNMDQTDLCPIEKLSQDINQVQDLEIKIEEFLQKGGKDGK